MNLAKYLVWLNWLVTLASNAPVFIAAAMEFYSKVKDFLPKPPSVAFPNPEQGGLQLTQQMVDDTLATEVAEAELKVLSLCDDGTTTGAMAARDGTRLRELFAFLTMIRELLGGFGV